MKPQKLINILILISGALSIGFALISLIISFIYGISTTNLYLISFSLLFLSFFLALTVYFVIKNKTTIIKNPNKFTFYDYANQKLICVYLGKEYSAEGYSGLTDGVQVNGKLTEVEIQRDSATIWDKRLDMPCAVKLRTLKEI